jgi:signal peptidase I
VAGPSDAPDYLVGDLVIVNRAAYGLPIPYTHRDLLRWGAPRAGEVVLMRVPGREIIAFKVVTAVAGDTIEVRDGRVWRNGAPFAYEALDPTAFAWLPPENRLGPRLALESGPGGKHTVSLGPEAAESAGFGPVKVPEGHLFVLGLNRDHSLDSRHFGPVPQARVLGSVAANLSAAWRRVRGVPRTGRTARLRRSGRGSLSRRRPSLPRAEARPAGQFGTTRVSVL